MLDFVTLLRPLDGEGAGPDLTYDDGRRVIEDAFARDGEGRRREDVDWRDVVTRIGEQAARTRDLWLPIYLARAGAESGRLELVVDGAELLAGLLEHHWDAVHPMPEDEDDPSRKLACDSLARHGEFIAPLQRLVLIEHPRLGRFTAADLERFARGGEAEEGYGLFRGALEQLDEATLTDALERLDRAAAAFRRADAALTERSGAGATDFQPLHRALHAIRGNLVTFAPAAAEPEMVEVELAPDAAPILVGGTAPTGASFQPGRIDGRDDVIRALDAIADYYRRCEPASPVPLALQRARAWVPMSFMEVLADVAPGSIDDAQRVLMSQAMIRAAEAE